MDYRLFTSEDSAQVKTMIRQYYLEDHPDQEMPEEQIDRTLNEFLNHPDKGSVILILEDNQVVGYSILVYLWSNEMGGDFINIDEVFVKPAFRGKGIGSNFIKNIIKNRFHDCVALELVTTPQNERARKLYSSLGFAPAKDLHMEYIFE